MAAERWWQAALLRFGGHRAARASGWLLISTIAVCFLLPPLLGLDPYAIDPSARHQGPSTAHWLGTDELGRDVLARLLFGGRVSLAVASISAFSSIAIGGAVGLVAGYAGGVLDAALMRATDALMALPRLPLMILLLAIDLEKLGLDQDSALAASIKLVAIIVLFGWTGAARLARAAALEAKEQDYVLAARALGTPGLKVLRDHLLPAAAAPLLVAATLEVGQIVLYESVLSYLGLGVRPPIPSWGAMLRDGMSNLYVAPLLTIVPGLITFVTVAAVNFVGDGLRDALDPRTT